MKQKIVCSRLMAFAPLRVKHSHNVLTFIASSCLLLAACSGNGRGRGSPQDTITLTFRPEQHLGESTKNPAAPFLRYRPDGRLVAIWTEDDDSAMAHSTQGATAQHHSGKMAASPMRDALLASSVDGGKTWTSPTRVNRSVEAIQAEENGPKVAFGADNRAYVVWSIPSAKGDKTRANIRFAMEDGKGGFSGARTVNEIRDAARFPIIEVSPDGNVLLAWIDRRIDNPKPRQLYMMKLDSDGKELTKNYSVAQGLCECCKLGVAFADGGKTFAEPVLISNDDWQVPSCPHSGPSIGRDTQGRLHVTWFTLGRSEKEAGIYYSVSHDDGESFAPRRLVHANTAPEILYSSLAVGNDDTVYLAWSNLDSYNRAQVFVRSLYQPMTAPGDLFSRRVMPKATLAGRFWPCRKITCTLPGLKRTARNHALSSEARWWQDEQEIVRYEAGCR